MREEIYLPEIAGRAGDAALVSDISVSPQGSAAAAAVSVSRANTSHVLSAATGRGAPWTRCMTQLTQRHTLPTIRFACGEADVNDDVASKSLCFAQCYYLCNAQLPDLASHFSFERSTLLVPVRHCGDDVPVCHCGDDCHGFEVQQEAGKT